MKKDVSIFIKHILESIENIEDFVEGSTKVEFLHCIKTQDAVLRRVGIIGEATKNLPSSFRKKFDELDK